MSEWIGQENNVRMDWTGKQCQNGFDIKCDKRLDIKRMSE